MTASHKSRTGKSQSVIETVLQVYHNRGETLDKAVGFHESLKNYQTMQRLAVALENEEARLIAMVEAGYRLALLGRIDEALAVHQSLSEELKTTKHKRVQNRNIKCLAIVLRLLGRYQESLAVQDSSDDARSSDEIKYHTWLNSRGHTLWRMGRHHDAIECFQRVLSWATQVSNMVHQATAHNNLGLVYSDMEMLAEAKMHHEEALRLRMTINDSGAICTSFLNLGNVFVQMGDIGAGLELWNRALEISRKLGDAATESMIENNMGELFYQTGDYGKAAEYFHNSLAMKEALNLRSYLASSLEGLVKVYYELRREPDKAAKCRLYGERLLTLEGAPTVKKQWVREVLNSLDKLEPIDRDKTGC